MQNIHRGFKTNIDYITTNYASHARNSKIRFENEGRFGRRAHILRAIAVAASTTLRRALEYPHLF